MPLTSWDESIATNGRFRADASVLAYIQFAYKLWPIEAQSQEFARLPKWAATDLFTIDARARGYPTKDQMRLMLQSLLTDRFQLAAHVDARKSLCSSSSWRRPVSWGRNSFSTPMAQLVMGPAYRRAMAFPDFRRTVIRYPRSRDRARGMF